MTFLLQRNASYLTCQKEFPFKTRNPETTLEPRLTCPKSDHQSRHRHQSEPRSAQPPRPSGVCPPQISARQTAFPVGGYLRPIALRRRACTRREEPGTAHSNGVRARARRHVNALLSRCLPRSQTYSCATATNLSGDRWPGTAGRRREV